MEQIKFPKAPSHPERERYFITYGDRDTLGDIVRFQGEWHAEFRFNGKDFTFVSPTQREVEGQVVWAIKGELDAERIKNSATH